MNVKPLFLHALYIYSFTLIKFKEKSVMGIGQQVRQMLFGLGIGKGRWKREKCREELLQVVREAAEASPEAGKGVVRWRRRGVRKTATKGVCRRSGESC